MTEGRKFDQEKAQWHLVPWTSMEATVRVLMHGASKYAPDNWKKVNPPIRYYDAAMRHLTAYGKGEVKDPETGESHLAHAVCSLLFLMWRDDNP